MKTLKLYILREFLPTYIGSMVFFSVILLFERLMYFVGLVAKGYANIIELILLIFFSLPPILAVTMPMSTLMGALISVSRLSHDGEILAIKASGIRLSAVFIALYFAGICIGIVSFFLTDKLVPVSNLKFRILYEKLILTNPHMQIYEKSINKINDDVTLLVDYVDEKTGALINITIFERSEGEDEKTINAQDGHFVTIGVPQSYITLMLHSGSIFLYSKTSKFSSSIIKFEAMKLNIPVESRVLKSIAKSPLDMDLKELKVQLSNYPEGSIEHKVYLIEFHKRIAIPFACVLFTFLGIPFIVRKKRTGKGLGLGIGVVIIFLYYVFFITLERVGKSGVFSPFLTAWLPNILFFIAGLINIILQRKS